MLTLAAVLPSFAGGGAERVALNLLAALDRRRIAPVLIALSDAGPLRTIVPPDLPVEVLGKSRLRQALPCLVAALRRVRPAVIFSTFGYMNLALLAARPLLPAGTRIVVREANLPSLSLPNAPLSSATKLGMQLLYRRANQLICSSQRMTVEFMRDFRMPADRIALMPNPVDEATVRAAATPPRREPGPGAHFVAAGRLTRQKGIDRLLKLLPQLSPHTQLTVLGDGPEAAPLRSQAERLNVADRVNFAGFKSVPWPFYAGADAFLLPSRWEGMPNAALEALACGTPVIATPDAGGLAEVVCRASDGAITIAACGEPFAAAMLAVREKPTSALRPSLLPEEFLLSRVVARFEALLLQTA